MAHQNDIDYTVGEVIQMFNNLLIIFADIYSLGCIKPGNSVTANARRSHVIENRGVNYMLTLFSPHTEAA